MGRATVVAHALASAKGGNASAATATEASLVTAPPFRFRRLDHVVLRCRDIAAMTAFYVGTLGCEADWLGRFNGTLTHLRVGESLIDLVQAGCALSFEDPASAREEGPVGELQLRPSSLDHVALRCDDYDPRAAEAWLASRGAEVIASGPRYGADGNGHSVYVRDPEGNVVELKCGPLPHL